MHHENETIEHRRDEPRLGSAFLGSLECLVQQALDDMYGQNILSILTFAITYTLFYMKGMLQNHN